MGSAETPETQSAMWGDAMMRTSIYNPRFSDVVIVLDGDDGATLLDVQLTDLYQDNFVFSI